MSAQQRLWQIWQRQLRALLATTHAWRVDGLAVMVLGMVWSGQVALGRIAAVLPFAVHDASTERRLRRWVQNPHVSVPAIWGALLPRLVAASAGGRPVFVFDPTPHQATATVLAVGLVVRRRVLPVAWRLVPQQEHWPRRMMPVLRELLTEVNAALPPGCAPTLVVDRGITSAALVDLCREVGWHLVARLNTGPRQSLRVRLGQTEERRLWDLVTQPGQRWSGRVELFKDAGWRVVELTIYWARGAAAPWVLLSDEPAGAARVSVYRQRVRCEATYLDCKRRGWNIEASKLRQHDRLNRLLLALSLAFWWTYLLGLGTIRAGLRRRFDRADRRDLSVVRLGRCRFLDELARDRCPPLPFRFRHGQWRTRALP